MKHLLKIVAVVLVAFGVSCQELPNYFAGSTTLARVGRTELKVRDIEDVVPASTSGEDSVALVEIYINRWVVKQLKIQEAGVLFSASEDDIAQKVEEYRQSLLTHKVDQYYVDNSVAKEFAEDDILTYYNEHRQDLRLDKTMVKGRVLRFNDHYRQTSKLLDMMRATSPDYRKDFADVCAKHNFPLADYTQDWVSYTDFMSNLPVVRSQNYDGLLNRVGEIQKMNADGETYYFQIEAILRAGETMPLDMARDNILRTLQTQRQSEIIRLHEEDILRAAVEGGQAKIYREKIARPNESEDVQE